MTTPPVPDGRDTELAAAIGFLARNEGLLIEMEHSPAGRAAATIVRAYLAAQGVELDGDDPDFPDHETIGKVRREAARSTERNEFGAYIKTPVLRRIADLAERAVLARPAVGRDLTAQDVRDAARGWAVVTSAAAPPIAEHLNGIARPSGKPPAGCGLCSPKALRDDDPDLLTGYSGNDDGEEPAAPADGPMCRYCGADCSGGRSWDGGDFYACPSCADARATRNAAPADDTAPVESRDERVDRLTDAVGHVCDAAAIEVEVHELDPGPSGWQRSGQVSPLRRLVRAMDGAGMLRDNDPADDTAAPDGVARIRAELVHQRDAVQMGTYLHRAMVWAVAMVDGITGGQHENARPGQPVRGSQPEAES